MHDLNHILQRPNLQSIIARFEGKFSKGDGCWEWTAATVKPLHYGRFAVQSGVNVLAHRLAFVIYCGEIPQGMRVLHRCDNPRCVNPAHLFIGTSAENMEDMVRKKRRVPNHGERHSMVKLTEEQVREILRSRDIGTVLADRFGVSPKQISRIRRGESWGHLTTAVS